jgi:hypothetical protein
MKVVGVVTSLGVDPGLYARTGVDEERVAEGWNAAATTVAGLRAATGAGAVLAGARVASMFLASGVVALAFPAVALGAPAYFLWKNWDKLFGRKATQPLMRVQQALLPSPELESAILPSRVVVIPHALLGGEYSDFNSPVFHGLFTSESQLRTMMTQEGGNSELHIMEQATVARFFRHPGEGMFSRGLHVPHPKDPFTLIPMAEYDRYLKEEILYEWVRVFEALGARSIVIGDSTTAKASGKSSHVNPVGSVEAAMRIEYGNSKVECSAFEAGGFDPGRATSDRKWLGDFPAIKAIVEGRVQGQQSSWRRTVEVDLSVGASVEVLALAAPSLTTAEAALKYHKKFDLYVEFHPKR